MAQYRLSSATTIPQISEINAESSKPAIYNMNGIMMGYDLDKLPKGIYLWKGKKVKK